MLLELPGLEIKLREWTTLSAAGRHGIPERGLAIVLEEGREHPLNCHAVGMVFPFREDEAPCCIVCGL